MRTLSENDIAWIRPLEYLGGIPTPSLGREYLYSKVFYDALDHNCLLDTKWPSPGVKLLSRGVPVIKSAIKSIINENIIAKGFKKNPHSSL